MAEPWTECKCGVVHEAGCHGHVRSRDGAPCGQRPILGATVCAKHGGNRVAVKAAAARNVKVAELTTYMARLGTPPEVDPVDALLSTIAWTHAEVEYLRGKVMEIDDGEMVWGLVESSDKTGGEDWGTKRVERAGVNVWLQLYHQRSDKLVEYTAKAISAGLEERRVKVAESVGTAMIGVLRAIMADVLSALQSAGITRDQAEVFRSVFDGAAYTHLRAIRGGRDDEKTTLLGGN